MSTATPADTDIDWFVREAIERSELPVHESAHKAIVATGRAGMSTPRSAERAFHAPLPAY